MSTSSIVGFALGAEPVALLTKVTLLLVGAHVIAFALRRAAAAVRHLVWLVSLAACAAIVLLSPFAPAISLRISRTAAPIAQMDDLRRMPDASPPLPSGSASTASGRATRSIVGERPLAAPRGALTSRLRSNGVAIVVVLWLLGCALVVARCLIGHAVIARLVWRAGDVDPESWRPFIDSLPGRRDDVRLLSSDAVASPITIGWARPIILLPMEADGWSAERRQLVLVHELAHVSRGDYLSQLVGTAATALLWFHPLAWIGVARLRSEAEHAADDCVLASGVVGADYAMHLLEIARAARPLHLSAAIAVGMARSSHIEHRIRAMLDERRTRRGIAGRTVMIATVISVGLLTPLAGLRAVARAAAVLPASQLASEPPAPPVAAPPQRQIPRAARDDNPTTHADSLFEKVIDAARGAHLRATLPTGAGIVIRGWDSTRVRVRAELGGRDWQDVRIALDRDGSDARLSSTFVNGGTHSTELWFQIWVPRQTNIEINSAGGSVDISNVDGDIVGETGGGTITIRNAHGYADFSTGGGEIEVADSDLRGRVSTGWGRINIHDVTGNLSGISASDPRSRYETRSGYGWGSGAGSGTSSGGIGPTSGSSYSSSHTMTTTNSSSCVAVSFGGSTVSSDRSDRDAPHSGGIRATEPLSVTKPGGNIDVAFAPEGATLSTGGGHIIVDESGKSVVASTGGGNISLSRTAGDATVSTGAGDVTIAVVNAGGAAHHINVCDGSGRVILELPADLDATFELETAYTENFGRRTTISTDFPLDQTETSSWDDRSGTPRKFVRAMGRSGSGAGLIRVTTVNGDIVVQRR